MRFDMADPAVETNGMAKITALYRYPLKGFSPQPLAQVDVAAGGTIPFDRAFAVENGPSGFDPSAPDYLRKTHFLMLMRNERIAEFRSQFDETSGEFSVFKNGALQIDGSLNSEAGRARIEAWLAETFRDELRGAPRILSAAGHSFSDMPAKVLHLINLESVQAFSDTVGRPVDPMRFRPNIVVDNMPAWSELAWKEGAEISLPDMTLTMVSRTERCAATTVDPQTARRDMPIPKTLAKQYGHTDFGVYLAVKSGGVIKVGDALALVG